jgi:hypothetical protein
MPSKIYTAFEGVITFADSAQTPSAVLTLSALASGAGRISARYDRGTGSIATLYRWRATFQLTGTNVVGAAIELYVSSSDGTRPDGEIGTADAALTTDKRKNLIYAGTLIVDQTTTNTNMTASGVVWVPNRYFSVGVWNATTLPLTTSTSVHSVKFTPVPDESQ